MRKQAPNITAFISSQVHIKIDGDCECVCVHVCIEGTLGTYQEVTCKWSVPLASFHRYLIACIMQIHMYDREICMVMCVAVRYTDSRHTGGGAQWRISMSFLVLSVQSLGVRGFGCFHTEGEGVHWDLRPPARFPPPPPPPPPPNLLMVWCCTYALEITCGSSQVFGGGSQDSYSYIHVQ